MNPLLLVALVVGGGFAAIKVVQKVSKDLPECLPQIAPTAANPFFDVNGRIDFAAIAKTAEAANAARSDARSKTVAATAGALAAAATATGIGAAAAPFLVAGGALYGVADKYILSKIGEDPNGQDASEFIDFWAKEWGRRGFIVSLPGPSDTLKAIGENLYDALDRMNLVNDHFAEREPYLKTVLTLSGELFKKWGAHPAAANLAMWFITDPTGATLGSIPSGGERSLEESHYGPRLKLASMVFALEYGVPCDAPKIYAAASSAAERFDKVLFWKTELRPEGRSQGSVQQVMAMYQYLVGVHAAWTKAAELAKQPPPPPLTEITVRYPNGIPLNIPATHKFLAQAAGLVANRDLTAPKTQMDSSEELPPWLKPKWSADPTKGS